MNRDLFKGDRSQPMTHYSGLSSVLTPLTRFQGQVGLGATNREGYRWGRNRLFL
ncbi:hypothetical protein NG796_17595 [Laspinema sp. A4]|uniref:hypothetical protein n=1 Tax=Laspinema sp. D2d TaxID=2953686 RepID=UPI0021BAC663|nr:hypothetical protein [Laspinema sp. D2d]MCT7985089.1 hypothetical protein [Laspinema sp. D2d]